MIQRSRVGPSESNIFQLFKSANIFLITQFVSMALKVQTKIRIIMFIFVVLSRPRLENKTES